MRLRFSIRDLLWLTLVVAILVAWWVDHRRIQDDNVRHWLKLYEETGEYGELRKALADPVDGNTLREILKKYADPNK